MLHARTRCRRPAIQPRTHASANKRASWKFSRIPCVRCLSLAGGQGCACPVLPARVRLVTCATGMAPWRRAAAGHAHAPSTAWAKKQKGNEKEQQQDNSNLLKSKTPRGHRRVGPPFPANPWYKVSNFHHKILTLGEKREEEKEQGEGDGKSSALLFLRQKKNWKT
jgi:hypothetical protein